MSTETGGQPAPVPNPEPTPAPPPPPPQPTPQPAPDLTAMLMQRLTAAEVRTAELEAAQRQREAEAARAEQDRLADKGDAAAARAALEAARAAHEKEVAVERGKLAEVETRARTSFRDRELAMALAGKPLVPGAAEQLAYLFRDQLQAVPENDGYAVRTKDFVAASAFVEQQLAKPEYSHFLQATTTGGTQPSNAHRTTATPTADDGRPLTLGEQLIKDAMKGSFAPQVPVGRLN